MSKTWDVLDRETGKHKEVVVGRDPLAGDWYYPALARAGTAMALLPCEVAYCRETGEVVYL